MFSISEDQIKSILSSLDSNFRKKFEISLDIPDDIVLLMAVEEIGKLFDLDAKDSKKDKFKEAKQTFDTFVENYYRKKTKFFLSNYYFCISHEEKISFLNEQMTQTICEIKKIPNWEHIKASTREEMFIEIDKLTKVSEIGKQINQQYPSENLSFFERLLCASGDYLYYLYAFHENSEHYLKTVVLSKYTEYLRDKIHDLSKENPKEKGDIKADLGFRVYITHDEKDTIISYLSSKFQAKKPKKFVYELIALRKKGWLASNILSENQTALHNLVCNTFGNVGANSAFRNAITQLDVAVPSQVDLNIVKTIMADAQTYLDSATSK